MIPAATIAKLATLGLSADQAEAVAAMLVEVEQATEAKAGEALGAHKAPAAIRTARYRADGGGNISGDIRGTVYERDGFQCVYCGSGDNLQCDHVVPVSKGGETSLDNLATACRVCAAKKKDRERKAFERSLSKEVHGQVRTVRGQTRTDRTDAEPPPKVSPLRDNQTPLPNPPSSLRSVNSERAEFCDRVWKIIPKRRGDAPKPFRTALMRALAGGVDPTAIIAGLERYIAAERGCDPQFRKGAAVWVNGHGWEADYSAQPRAGPEPPRSKETFLTRLSLGIDANDQDHDASEIDPDDGSVSTPTIEGNWRRG